MAQLYNLQFRTKMKADGSNIQYFTQVWLKNGKNIKDFCDALNELMANSAHVGASQVVIRPTDSQIELNPNVPRVNEQVISLGWRGSQDDTVFTSVRVPCLQQTITTDALNAILTEYVCGAPQDSQDGVSGTDTPLDPSYVWQNARSVRYVQPVQGT